MLHLKATLNNQVGVDNGIDHTMHERFSFHSFFVTVTDGQESISEGNQGEE
jgi:hypothetical protein